VRRKGSVLLPVVLVVASFLVVSARKIFEYAAAPNREKERDFVFPQNTDQENPTVFVSEPKAPPISFKQLGGFTNDASHLNKTAIYGVARIANEEDIRNALEFARENKQKVTCAGLQHSMGGQSFTHGGWCLIYETLTRSSSTKNTKASTSRQAHVGGNSNDCSTKKAGQ